jgi:hypothetical protein
MKLALQIHEEYSVPRPQPKSLQQGISTGLRALLDPDLSETGGVYLNDCEFVNGPKELALHAVDPANALQCWTMTEGLIHEKFSVSIN